jgi:hypothetical protein
MVLYVKAESGESGAQGAVNITPVVREERLGKAFEAAHR